MYRHKRILGLIPARGGSQGIPDKNICLLHGKPLIAWTIEAGARSTLLDGLYCSTNDDRIAAVASKDNLCQIIWRPDCLCTSTARTIECVIHALDTLKKEGKTYDYILILQATSPLRRVEYIDGIIRHVIDHDLPAAVSVSEIPYLPTLMRTVDEQNPAQPLKALMPGSGDIMRQAAPKNYYVDGMLCLYKTAEIARGGVDVALNEAPFAYIVPKEDALDINEPFDLMLCEVLMRQKRLGS